MSWRKLLSWGAVFVKPLGLTLVLAALMGSSPASADAVWHCSRAQQVSGLALPEAEDNFQSASANPNADAIGISLMDLIDAYSGTTVSLGGRPLTACFMPGGTALSDQALSSLGLNWSVMQQMARKSAIVQSHLQLVTDEAAMLACVAKRFPAVGYLSEPTVNERVVPCF